MEWIKEGCEHFTEWNKSFHLWKPFYYSQKNVLKYYVGLAFFGIPDQCQRKDNLPSSLEIIWHSYTEKQRKTITEITNKLQFEYSHVSIGHTYLFLDNRSSVCVLRQIKNNGDIIFIDHNGRFYNSWNNFCSTNVLPSCQFIAPKDGLHKLEQELFKYTSPAATPSHQILQATDGVVGTCSIVSAGLMALTLAPVTALCLGTIGIVYGVTRSIGVLNDRSSHNQSIGLNNAESIVAWSTIGLSAATGVSSVALAKSADIVKVSGNNANFARAALKGANYAPLALSVCNLGTHAYILRQKLINDEKITAYDYLQLCVNAFLVFGQVANTRLMNKYINSLEAAPSNTTAPARLTRTAKRRLQRLRAKLREKNCASVKEVRTIFDQDFGYNIMLIAGHQLISRHTNVETICMKCQEILYICKQFLFRKMTLLDFVHNMINHVKNLFILVSEDLKSIKLKAESFLNQYFPRGDVPPSLTEQIGLMVKNTTTALKREDEQQQPTENESKLEFEIILEAAKNRIPCTTQSSQVISEFNKQLSSLIDEITTELNNNYEEFVSKNIQLSGKIEAERVFSKLGIKTLNDFANCNFYKVMESKNNNGELIPFNRDDEILQKALTAYKSLLAKMEPQSILSQLGALGACQLLKESVINFFNPLGETLNTANNLYDINVSYLGHSRAMEFVFYTLKVNSPIPNAIGNSTFFNLAIEKLNFDKIDEMLSAAIRTEKRTSKISNQFDDENVHITVLLLCDKFYRKVELKLSMTSNSDREKRVKDCYFYLLKNFTAFMETKKKEQNAEISYCSKLQNSPFLDEKSFIAYYKKVSEFNNQEMFASAVEHFTAENNLASLTDNYLTTCKVVNKSYVPCCDDILSAEDGLRIYTINDGTYSNLRAYKNTAAEVFGLNECDMELLKWEKGTVIFKCGYNKNVVFQNVDTKSMILMEVDTSKQGPISTLE